ncbi:HelD family protein [Streptomyces sp. NBC_01477]|uniref:HelD family protein n=1 Tax=Streptomyces sp. NBC_01477 TaxID=2976015 RepID=UPI002E315169|nr:ATP-binding domain-containing protein [Streptomyces sp. NBC_01477]
MSAMTRDEIIAVEQKAVDRAYDCYAEQLKELSGHSVASASASGKDSVANRMEAEERAAAYGGLGGESLVISRVDIQDEPKEGPETWYVGRRGVRDTVSSDRVVVLWTSPLAKKWADALPDSPGQILLRRKLRCTQHIVEDYLDEIAAPVSEPQPAADAASPRPRPSGARTPRQAERRPSAPTSTGSPSIGPSRVRRRQPEEPDDFLLRELRRSRDGSMRDIVETIRRDQMALVTGSPSDILIVQGGPGTGKSAVGLHRVTWLVDNEHFKAQDILVIGPHQQFLEYVSRVLPTLGTRNVNAVQVSHLWDDGESLGTDTAEARLVKSDERMAAVLQRRVEQECRPTAVDEFTTTATYKDAKPELTIVIGRTTLRVPRSEILELLDEARGGGGSHRERRAGFRSLVVDRLLKELFAQAPRRGHDDTIRRDLQRNRQVERLVERVWPSPSAREALRALYHSPDLLRSCAEGILDDGEREALRRPRAESVEAEPWTLDDHVCLEELRHLLSGETPQRYGHIVIDEAQDLTPMQARSLRRRSAANGSMTVLGDLAQATGPHAYPDWNRLGDLFSDHGDWRVEELNTSYRVPSEIMEFVSPLARTIAPALPRPEAVRAAGDDAVRVVETEPWRLLDETVAQATRLIGTNDGRAPRSVAVIVPDDSGWLDEIGRQLERAEDVSEPQREVLHVLPAAQAKGMEYDHVLVVEPVTIADRGSAGLRQLYIALTRSTQSLTVLHASPLPAALVNLDDAPDSSSAGADPGPASDVPEIGTDVRVRVVEPGPGGRYKVKALSPVMDIPLVLTVRHGSVPPRRGEQLDCWVFAHETNHSLVTADQRGRQPISPRMAERYVAALGILHELIDGTAPQDARDRLSELKGMANRVLRRDQADWVDVRRVLGSPDRSQLGQLRDIATSTHRALKDNNLDVNRLRDDLTNSGWLPALAAALEELQGRLASSAEPPSEPAGSAPGEQPEHKEDEPVTTADRPSPAVPLEKPLLLALETQAAADRTCKKHEAARHTLIGALLWADLQPDDSPIVDVSCGTNDGHLLYEVLGAGHSSYADLRAGAVRLMEITHTLSSPADRLYLVLSEPPAEDWSAGTVLEVFGVHVLWRTADGWAGQDVARAIGAQSDVITK